MVENERAEYYLHRAAQARDLAERARSPEARAIHLDLAKRYTQLLRYARSDRPLLIVVDGGRQPAAGSRNRTSSPPRSSLSSSETVPS